MLDVKIRTFPTHAASKPVAMIPNCAATRHAHFVLDGSGPVALDPPSLDLWPDVHWKPSAESRRVNLDALTREEVRELEARTDAAAVGPDAHRARCRAQAAGGAAELRARAAAGRRPARAASSITSARWMPVRDEAVGPAGPTTATRMDKFTDLMLEKTGLFAMIGKAERGPVAIEAIRKHGAAYLIAIGGAAYLVSKAIRKARVVAFEDLGMEAIYEFEVEGHAGDGRGRFARGVGARDGAAGVGREDQGAEDSRARRLMRGHRRRPGPCANRSAPADRKPGAGVPQRRRGSAAADTGAARRQRGRQFLVMPAFDPDGSAAVKLVTYVPENAGRGLPTVQAAVVAFSREGTPVAVLDGTMVTRIRTAAASALASKYLSRADSSRLTVVGTGALAPWMAAAHAVVRPIESH